MQVAAPPQSCGRVWSPVRRLSPQLVLWSHSNVSRPKGTSDAGKLNDGDYRFMHNNDTLLTCILAWLYTSHQSNFIAILALPTPLISAGGCLYDSIDLSDFNWDQTIWDCDERKYIVYLTDRKIWKTNCWTNKHLCYGYGVGGATSK